MSESTNLDLNNLDIEKLAQGLLENFKNVENIMSDFSKTYEQMDLDPFNLKELYTEWFTAAIQNPQKLAQANVEFWQKAMQLYQRSAMGFLGINADAGDRRGAG